MFGSEQLRAAADCAHAWTETLIDYDFVDNHGIDAEYRTSEELLQGRRRLAVAGEGTDRRTRRSVG
jgi:hypothetical protein